LLCSPTHSEEFLVELPKYKNPKLGDGLKILPMAFTPGRCAQGDEPEDPKPGHFRALISSDVDLSSIDRGMGLGFIVRAADNSLSSLASFLTQTK
jgi:hypothetical protein